MTKEEAMLKIKDQLKKLMSFSEEATEPAEEKKYSTMKLKDGSEISIADGTELGVGVEVFKIDADGNQVPAEDGEYELEDGRKITLKGGMVESIAEVEVAEAEKVDETPMDPAQMNEAPGIGAPAEGESNPVEERISALESQIAQILELLQGMGQMQEVAMSKIEKLSSQPATESIKVGKKPEMSNTTFSSLKNEIDELKDMRKKFNISNNGGYSFNATTAKK